MMYDHYKADGVFLSIAMIGYRILEEQARQAARIAAALGDPYEITLLDKADLMYDAYLDLATRVWFWEGWKAVERVEERS